LLVGVVRKLYTADKDRRANESVERLGQTKVDFPKKNYSNFRLHFYRASYARMTRDIDIAILSVRPSVVTFW